ncbi:MAG: Rne/Rng family ribonuclease [Saprospiraceae bacterium]|nr:Rne/Rng family ribonuclease [Saprospiraceae bacterium]
MSKELIIHTTPAGAEIGLLEDKKLVEFHKEAATSQFNIGDIYLARVKKVVPSLNAAFIDVGYTKDGFLHYTDLGPNVRSLLKYANRGNQGKLNTHLLGSFKKEPEIIKTGKIDKVLSRRDKILVQVVKEPISTKGPRLTSEVGIPGRTMVLTPFNNFVGVSKKIADAEERKRLKRLISSIKPEGFGVIVRTNAVGKGVAYLHQELEKLLERWEAMTNALTTDKLPHCVHSEAGMTRGLLRDYVNESLSKIIVDSKSIHNDIKDYLEEIAPEQSKIVQLHHGDRNIFTKFDVTKQIKSAFGRQVKMDSGAYLVIEHTEALHVIDVNSGNRISSSTEQDAMALQVNLESADEIARQLRLRDLGGIIIIDFIDMRNPEYKKQLYRRMKDAMAKDKAKHLVLQLSRFGLMQITRQRTKPVLNITTQETCSTCNGTGKTSSTLLLADEIENGLRKLFDKKKESVIVEANPIVAGYLKKGWPSPRMNWSWKYKTWIKITPDENLPLTEYKYLNKSGQEIEI